MADQINAEKVDETVIHPSAVVEKGAELGVGVKIGPFCYVGQHAKLGDRVELISHASIINRTTVGSGTRVSANAILGGEPQHVGYRGEPTSLEVGSNNTIREGVTMNLGMPDARGTTVVGDNNMFLAYSHVAHDCVLGNFIVFANNVMIGGHTEIGDHVILGGGSGVHQFCRIGERAFVGGMVAVGNDVIPYGMVVGSRGFLGGLNIVGLKRAGMDREQLGKIRAVYKELFVDGDGALRETAARLRDAHAASPEILKMLDFILHDSKRKFLTPISYARKRGESDEA